MNFEPKRWKIFADSKMPVGLEDHVNIADDNDMLAARQRGRMLAAEVGFSPSGQVTLVAVITELARNIIHHATRGELVVQVIEDGDRRGIAVIARDSGPGIPNIKDAMQASYSVEGGLGLGLRGVKGVVDSLEIISVPGSGTTVTARKWLA